MCTYVVEVELVGGAAGGAGTVWANCKCDGIVVRVLLVGDVGSRCGSVTIVDEDAVLVAISACSAAEVDAMV